mmetsp:Transcript_12750/g.23015  ORF Transcript_12750/g.23015 Transcript_12750/m.23015 type:complete len:92 (-) Transcript_12750:509-784(-)
MASMHIHFVCALVCTVLYQLWLNHSICSQRCNGPSENDCLLSPPRTERSALISPSQPVLVGFWSFQSSKRIAQLHIPRAQCPSTPQTPPPL